MSGFGEVQAAGRARDIFERIAEGVVKKMRPQPFLAKVYDIDLNNQVARVMLPGETLDNLLHAHFALNKVPRNVMADFPELGIDAPGDIVRIWGGSGNYFILDFFAGLPLIPGETTVTSLHNDPSFEIQPWINGYPNGWSSFWNNGGPTYFQEGNDVIDGKYSLRVIRPDGAMVRVHSKEPFSVVPGEPITISAMAKASGSTGIFRILLLTAPTSAGADFFGTGLTQQLVDQAMEVIWKKHEATFTIPASHTFARISFMVSNSSAAEMTFWVDDTASSRAEYVPWISMDGSDYTGQPVTLAAFWSNFGGSHRPCQYRKVEDEVRLHGLATVASGGTATIGTLPVGYRPGKIEVFFPANSDNVNVRLDINADGTIVSSQWTALNPGDWISLAGIRFAADG